jgi:hypothetical protein
VCLLALLALRVLPAAAASLPAQPASPPASPPTATTRQSTGPRYPPSYRIALHRFPPPRFRLHRLPACPPAADGPVLCSSPSAVRP